MNSFEQLQTRRKVLEWDIEYWEQYIWSYENKKIQCVSEEQRINDLEQCRQESQQCRQELEKFLCEHAHEFI